MSVLADVFIAHPDGVWSLNAGLDYRHFPHVQAARIDHVKIATLDEILTGEPDHVPDPLRETDDGDIQIVSIRQALANKLADLSDGQVPQVAGAWAATEEWQLDGGTADDLAEWLLGVRTLAQHARLMNTKMFVGIRV